MKNFLSHEYWPQVTIIESPKAGVLLHKSKIYNFRTYARTVEGLVSMGVKLFELSCLGELGFLLKTFQSVFKKKYFQSVGSDFTFSGLEKPGYSKKKLPGLKAPSKKISSALEITVSTPTRALDCI